MMIIIIISLFFFLVLLSYLRSKKKKRRGLFIVVDGGEGAGKGTQLDKLKAAFGDRLVLTREPGGTSYAEEIRSLILKSENASQADAKTMFALFWAARADHLKNKIRPALEAGKIVISDRFDSSTYAYQIIAQGASELEEFFWQMRDFYLGDCKPDLYVYFDVDPEAGLKRKSLQGDEESNHFESKALNFHKMLRSGFVKFLSRVRHKIIDASKSIEEVHQEFLLVLQTEINKL